MVMDFTNQNLRGKRFQRQQLENADFSGTDLRGATFSFANLKGPRFVKVKTGITTASKILLFLFSLVLSLISGYMAMLSGSTAQILLRSPDPQLRIGGYITTAFFLVFTIAAVWKGLFKAINTLLPVMIVI